MKKGSERPGSSAAKPAATLPAPAPGLANEVALLSDLRALDEQILATLSQTLSWSHFVELLPISDPLARDFYAEMYRIERWDVRTLRRQIGGLLFQRTALSKKPQVVIAAEIGKLRDGHAREQAARRPLGSGDPA
jgi:hypothetical protein